MDPEAIGVKQISGTMRRLTRGGKVGENCVWKSRRACNRIRCPVSVHDDNGGGHDEEEDVDEKRVSKFGNRRTESNKNLFIQSTITDTKTQMFNPQVQKSLYSRYLRRTGGASNIGTTTSTSVISFPKSGFESSRISSVLVVTL